LKHSKDYLKKEFGQKVGETLWEHARGIDNKKLQIIHQRKSVGSQISWGVRFDNNDQLKKFLKDISAEVSQRMKNLNVKGKRVTLKVRKKKQGTEESNKFMNPGENEIVTKSGTLNSFTDEPEVIASEAETIFEMLAIDLTEVRGIGLHLDQLDNQVKLEEEKENTENDLRSFFHNVPKNLEEEQTAFAQKNSQDPLTATQATTNLAPILDKKRKAVDGNDKKRATKKKTLGDNDKKFQQKTILECLQINPKK